MRADLLRPIADQAEFATVPALVTEAYRLHEAGLSTDAALHRMADFVGHDPEATRHSFVVASGSMSSPHFAENLLLEDRDPPRDLSRSKMLKPIERVCDRKQPDEEFLCDY